MFLDKIVCVILGIEVTAVLFWKRHVDFGCDSRLQLLLADDPPHQDVHTPKKCATSELRLDSWNMIVG